MISNLFEEEVKEKSEEEPEEEQDMVSMSKEKVTRSFDLLDIEKDEGKTFSKRTKTDKEDFAFN